MKVYNKIVILILLISFCWSQSAPVFAQLSLPSVVVSPQLGSYNILSSVLNIITIEMVEDQQVSCQNLEKGFQLADTVSSWAFGGLSLVTGDANQVAKFTAKIGKIDTFIACRTALQISLKALPKSDLYSLEQAKRIDAENSATLNTLAHRKDQLLAERDIAQKGLLKGIIISSLIKTTKYLSQQLVFKLTQKFKIADYQKYIDAVAGTVYVASNIQNSTSDKKAQMILRSMINNDLVAEQLGGIDPAIQAYADDALGFDAHDLAYNDPSFYAKLYKTGMADTDANFLQSNFKGVSKQINSMSLATANTEVSLGGGLKVPRHCQGDMNLQLAADQSFKSAKNEYNDRQKLLRDLVSAKAAGKNVSASDIQKAQADMISAQKKLNSVPNQLNKGIVQYCDSIVSPASLVNKGIDEAFGAFSDSLKNYNDNNLPLVMNMVSDVAAQISSNLIFGGQANIKNVLLSEAGNLDQLIAGSINEAQNNYEENLKQGVKFEGRQAGTSDPSEWNIDWEIIDVSKLSDADHVRVVLLGKNIPGALPAEISGKNLPTTGSVTVRLSGIGLYTYQLQVYNKKNLLIGKGSITINIPTVPEAAQTSSQTATQTLNTANQSSGSGATGNLSSNIAPIIPNTASNVDTSYFANKVNKLTSDQVIACTLIIEKLSEADCIKKYKTGGSPTLGVMDFEADNINGLNPDDVLVCQNKSWDLAQCLSTYSSKGTVQGAFISNQPIRSKGANETKQKISPRGEMHISIRTSE